MEELNEALPARRGGGGDQLGYLSAFQNVLCHCFIKNLSQLSEIERKLLK